MTHNPAIKPLTDLITALNTDDFNALVLAVRTEQTNRLAGTLTTEIQRLLTSIDPTLTTTVTQVVFSDATGPDDEAPVLSPTPDRINTTDGVALDDDTIDAINDAFTADDDNDGPIRHALYDLGDIFHITHTDVLIVNLTDATVSAWDKRDYL